MKHSSIFLKWSHGVWKMEGEHKGTNGRLAMGSFVSNTLLMCCWGKLHRIEEGFSFLGFSQPTAVFVMLLEIDSKTHCMDEAYFKTYYISFLKPKVLETCQRVFLLLKFAFILLWALQPAAKRPWILCCKCFYWRATFEVLHVCSINLSCRMS